MASLSKCFLLLLATFLVNSLLAQVPEQTVRGTIMDAESTIGIGFSTIALFKDSVLIKTTNADEAGKFTFEKIPVGRYNIVVKALGYNMGVVKNIILTSAKEVVLNIKLEEKIIATKEVVIKGKSNKMSSWNEMAMVSARTFSVEETNRYAGSRADPARMASNFAGVQGSDDSRNDIVVRGNTPAGVLYNFEDINIPNPNHFAVSGTTGGSVSILNNKTIGTSDFITGAFPAEYGNAISAVFDISMRPGNNEKYEFTGQFGVLGAELFAEGPLSKSKNSSFIVSYRNATLKLLQNLQIPIGTDAVPYYKDLSFKLNFPLSNNANLSFFGIGGKSHIDIMVSNKEEQGGELYGQDDRDQYFKSDMGVIGSSYSKVFSKKTYGKITLAYSHSGSKAVHELALRDSFGKVIFPLPQVLGYDFKENKQSISAYVNTKLDTRNLLKAGLYIDCFNFNFLDSLRVSPSSNLFNNRWNTDTSNIILAQPYVQYRYKFSEKFLVTAGLHFLYFNLTKSTSLEPRAGMEWQMLKDQSLSFGYGLHSMTLPNYLYFYHKPGAPLWANYNKDVDLMKAHHFVLSYNNRITNDLRLRIETYYQYLFDVPVNSFASSFSILNQGSGTSRVFPDTLVNEGTGRNYGVELTLEKFFSKQYFYMFTGSLFDSKYRGSDDVLRNTDFNGHFALNALAGREFKIKENVLTLGSKLTWAGGKLYGPIDTATSLNDGEFAQLDAQRNTLQFPNYFRADLKISYRINKKKITHEIALDLVNIFGTKNILSLAIAKDPKTGEVYSTKQYQLGFLPIIYYKIDFTH